MNKAKQAINISKERRELIISHGIIHQTYVTYYKDRWILVSTL